MGNVVFAGGRHTSLENLAGTRMGKASDDCHDHHQWSCPAEVDDKHSVAEWGTTNANPGWRNTRHSLPDRSLDIENISQYQRLPADADKKANALKLLHSVKFNHAASLLAGKLL